MLADKLLFPSPETGSRLSGNLSVVFNYQSFPAKIKLALAAASSIHDDESGECIAAPQA